VLPSQDDTRRKKEKEGNPLGNDKGFNVYKKGRGKKKKGARRARPAVNLSLPNFNLMPVGGNQKKGKKGEEPRGDYRSIPLSSQTPPGGGKKGEKREELLKLAVSCIKRARKMRGSQVHIIPWVKGREGRAARGAYCFVCPISTYG